MTARVAATVRGIARRGNRFWCDGVRVLCVDGAVELHDRCPFVRSQQGEGRLLRRSFMRHPDRSVVALAMQSALRKAVVLLHR